MGNEIQNSLNKYQHLFDGVDLSGEDSPAMRSQEERSYYDRMLKIFHGDTSLAKNALRKYQTLQDLATNGPSVRIRGVQFIFDPAQKMMKFMDSCAPIKKQELAKEDPAIELQDHRKELEYVLGIIEEFNAMMPEEKRIQQVVILSFENKGPRQKEAYGTYNGVEYKLVRDIKKDDYNWYKKEDTGAWVAYSDDREVQDRPKDERAFHRSLYKQLDSGASAYGEYNSALNIVMLGQNGLYEPGTGTHEMGHALFAARLADKNYSDEWSSDILFQNIFIFGSSHARHDIVDESEYLDENPAMGRPFENETELFASSCTVYRTMGDAFAEKIRNCTDPDQKKFGLLMWCYMRDKVFSGKVFTKNGHDPFAQYSLGCAALQISTKELQDSLSWCCTPPSEDKIFTEYDLMYSIQWRNSLSENAVLDLFIRRPELGTKEMRDQALSIGRTELVRSKNGFSISVTKLAEDSFLVVKKQNKNGKERTIYSMTIRSSEVSSKIKNRDEQESISKVINYKLNENDARLKELKKKYGK